jgi:hypothetical protein
MGRIQTKFLLDQNNWNMNKKDFIKALKIKRSEDVKYFGKDYGLARRQ